MSDKVRSVRSSFINKGKKKTSAFQINTMRCHADINQGSWEEKCSESAPNRDQTALCLGCWCQRSKTEIQLDAHKSFPCRDTLHSIMFSLLAWVWFMPFTQEEIKTLQTNGFTGSVMLHPLTSGKKKKRAENVSLKKINTRLFGISFEFVVFFCEW